MPPCVNTPEFLHAAMRPDVLTETVVEVSTEDSEPMEVVTFIEQPDTETEPAKKRKGVLKGMRARTQTHTETKHTLEHMEGILLF